MFTGMIEDKGKVLKVEQLGREKKLVIELSPHLTDVQLGDSININGACLTVTVIATGNFSVDIMPETTKLTNLKKLHPRDKVNLERAIISSGRFGGHFVQGHIDDVGRIVSMAPRVGAVIARISAPHHIMKYIVKKGFVAIDGCSLTVIDYDDFSFSVSLVDYTFKNTILGERKAGDEVNIEIDVIGKYTERFTQSSKNGVSWEVLQEYGFLKAR